MESRGLPALPIELWQIILLLACIPPPEREQFFPIPVYKTNVAPVLLSHVCRSWRYLVINCPEFWTDISYRFEDSITYGINPSSELMKLWLERSSAMPLILDIDIWDIGRPEEERSKSYEFLLALFSNRKRWTSATLHMLLEKIDDDAWEDIDALVEDAPLLETLKLTIEPEESEFSVTFSDTLAALWKGAPKLTKLAIEFVGPDEETDEETEEPDYISDWALTNGIPYHQLTHLLLDPDVNGEITWEEVSSIFALAQNLVSCSLHGIDGYYDEPHPSTLPVVLRYLQHLDLSGPYDHSEDRHEDRDETLLPVMNQTLTAPSLQTLSLLRSQDVWDYNAYADFIARSNPPLTALHFGLSPHKSPRSLLECIRLSPPTLRSLHTNHRKVFSPEFSKRMSEWDKDAGKFKLCPVLEQLAYTPDWSFFPKEMVNMLRTRLCPPDGSSPSFNKFIIPQYLRTELEAELEADLKPLTDDPYCLRLEYVREVLPEARVW